MLGVLPMKTRVLEKVKEEAIKELTRFLIITSEVLFKSGWHWEYCKERHLTEAFIPDNKSKIILITPEGSGKTIYGNPEINNLGRFWHDVTHRVLNIPYDLDSERKVIQRQLDCLKLFGLSQLAQELFWYDMFGQAYYYSCKGRYVENQKAFVDTCVLHGIKKACIANH